MSTYGNYSVNGQFIWAPGTYENWRCLVKMLIFH